MTRLEIITAACTTSIYTDHANLVYIFDPLGMNPGIAKYTASKLTRWALKLNEFTFIIKHISGDQNVWADILTRWAFQRRNNISAVKTEKRIKSVLLAPVNTLHHPDLVMPSEKDISNEQSKHRRIRPNNTEAMDGIWKFSNSRIWIPDQ